jgi:hypothetical protein
VRAADAGDIKAYFGFRPQGMRVVWGAFCEGRPIGICGIIRDPAYYGSLLEDDGRWIAVLDIDQVPPAFGLQVVLDIKRYLANFSDPLWAYCDTTYPTAEKLLHILGFRPTSEICANWRKPTQKVRVWQWRG